MKITRVLLLAVLLLSAFSSSAFASGQAVGFIQLVSKADPSRPMAVQAHYALQRLMPRLLAAQAAGQLVSFEPSLSWGVLKIVYRPSSGMPDLGGKTVYSEMQQAAPAPSADLAPRGGSCPGANFHLYLYSNRFSATCLIPGARIVGSLRNAAGLTLAIASETANSLGNINFGDFGLSSGPYPKLVPGFTLTFKEYLSGTLMATFTVKVPTIKFTSINGTSSIAQGTGPAGKVATLTWSHDRWDAADSTVSSTKVRTISSAGTWKVDFGTIPIRGNDYLGVDVAMNANFTFSTDMFAPASYCVLGGEYCELYGFPFAPANLQVVHGGSTYTFSGNFDEYGTFGVHLRTPGGVPIVLVPYDKISGTGVAQYGLPKLTANLNYTTDTVSGKVPANKYFDLWFYAPNSGAGFKVFAHSNSTGVYSVNVMSSHSLDLVAGDLYIADVFYVLPTTGNSADYFAIWGP